jgi:hypothetical protein
LVAVAPAVTVICEAWHAGYEALAAWAIESDEHALTVIDTGNSTASASAMPLR